MAETSKKIGKLGLAIIEDFVESKLDRKFVTGQRTSLDAHIIIQRAMQGVADRLWKEWTDKRLWYAMFNRLPKNEGLLTDLKQAVKIFYCDPADTGLVGVLKKILQEHQKLSPEAIQKAVRKYVRSLTNELLWEDADFRENARRLSDPKILKALSHVDQLLARQQRAIYNKTYNGVTPSQVEENELQAALTTYRNLPKRIPEPACLPKGSCFPNFRPNPLFVGREDALKQLAVLIKEKSPVVICQAKEFLGTGGVGKTQLASEFAHRYGQYFAGGVFWVNFAEPDLIQYQVAACGSLTIESPLEIRVKQVLSEWLNEKPRLLIFDNCEDSCLLMEWLPPTGGSRVLVTSCQSSWDPKIGAELLPLGPLDRRASIAMLRGFLKDQEVNNQDLNAIADELEDLPLALLIGGNFLHTYRQELSSGKYLNALHRLRLVKHSSVKVEAFSPIGHDLDVRRSFTICANRLTRENKASRVALELLRHISCLVPEELIPQDLAKTLIGETEKGEKVVEEGLDRLIGMGLVEKNEEGYVRMHRLVACFVREILPDKGVLAHVEQEVIFATEDANQRKDAARMQLLLAHLKYLTDQALLRKDERAAKLANELGFYLGTITDYQNAQSYYEKALAILRKELGDEDPETARSLNNLGFLLQAMGDYESARQYFEEVLAIRRKVLGEEHPDTARSLNNLGFLLQAMGDYASAQQYYEQALSIRKRVLGEEHPDTARSLNNLGYLLQTMGDLSGSQQYYKQALAIRRKVLDKENPDMAVSLNNLGSLLQAMGNLAGAQPYYEQALSIRRKVLGEEHPDTAVSLNNLGSLLQAMGDYAGARPYYEQALSIRRKVLGEEHPDTTVSLINMGTLLQEMGDYSNARPYYEQALSIRSKVLGEEHPDTVACLNNLAGLLKAKGNYLEAQTYYGRVLSIRRKVLGEEHDDTVMSLNNLGSLMEAMGNNPAARSYFEQALEIRKKVLSKKQIDEAARSIKPGYMLSTRIISVILFIFSFAIIGWQIIDPRPNPASLAGLIATPNKTNIPLFSLLFPVHTFTANYKTASARPTTTPTLTLTPRASSTSTRLLPYFFKPFPTSTLIIIYYTLIPTYTPLPTDTLFPTNTHVPTFIYIPTNTSAPTFLPPPTDTSTNPPTPRITPIPTETPSPRITPVPTETPSPRITPVPTETPPPIITPVPTEIPSPIINPLPTYTTGP